MRGSPTSWAQLIVLRWLPLLLFGAVVGAACGYVVVSAIPRAYAATAVLDSSNAGYIGGQNLVAAPQLARSYAESMRTRPILEEAGAAAQVSLMDTSLADHVRVTTVRNTPLLRVTVLQTDADTAVRLANAVVDAFVSQQQSAQAARFAAAREAFLAIGQAQRNELDANAVMIDALLAQPISSERDAKLAQAQATQTSTQTAYDSTVQSYQELVTAQSQRIGAMTVVQRASARTTEVRPNRPLALGLAALIGLLSAALIIAIFDYPQARLRDLRRNPARTGHPMSAMGATNSSPS